MRITAVAKAIKSSSLAGYTTAVLAPAFITLAVAWLHWPPFVYEHLVILLVVGVAVTWDLPSAVVCTVVAVGADDILLHEQAVITGYHDVVDLALLAAVAIIVSRLVTRARTERQAAEQAAENERHAREDRDRLIATVAHDLATPLSVLAGTVQLAQRFGMKSEAEQRQLLRRLETATGRATSLLSTLNDARELESEGFALTCAPLDLRALVGRIAEMMDHLSDRHPILLAVPETPVHVNGDAERLHRVMENLINNAIKYSPDGGAIEVAMLIEGSDAVTQVRDHGMGIPAESLSRIFDRSYRAPGAAARTRGLGLGLHIAAQVVARHNGTMQALAAPGGGAIVSFRLPVMVGDPLPPA